MTKIRVLVGAVDFSLSSTFYWRPAPIYVAMGITAIKDDLTATGIFPNAFVSTKIGLKSAKCTGGTTHHARQATRTRAVRSRASLP